MPQPTVLTGLDRLVAADFAPLRGQRVGLLAHPASVDRHLRHAVSLFAAAASVGPAATATSGAAAATSCAAATAAPDLRCLFGPQHGLRGETQDNMIEWGGYRDPVTGLPVHSLYGEVRKPTPQMLADIDTLVIDLQDVGARYYTFAWTLLLCLEACAEAGRRVVVLDRPNPLGGLVREGNLLDPDYRSFVGLAPIPMRHGLTLGELATYFRAHFRLDVDLEVIWMEGWRRAHWFDETGLPWVMPSPNLPTLDSVILYPGFCLLEGTELSEGRGTARPFEIFGAPFIDPGLLVGKIQELSGGGLPGCTLRPLYFEPTFQKHAGQLCGGAQVHVTERDAFRPLLAATVVLAAVHALWPEEFRWRQPPYEYEMEKLPIDILAGGTGFRQDIEGGRSPLEMAANWEAGLSAFTATVREFQHYD